MEGFYTIFSKPALSVHIATHCYTAHLTFGFNISPLLLLHHGLKYRYRAKLCHYPVLGELFMKYRAALIYYFYS